MATFTVHSTAVINVSLNVEAETVEEALLLARRADDSMWNLNSIEELNDQFDEDSVFE